MLLHTTFIGTDIKRADDNAYIIPRGVSPYNAVEAHLTSWFIARYGVAELELGGSPVRNCIIRHQGHTYRSLVMYRRVQSQSLVSFPLAVHRTLPRSLFSSLAADHGRALSV